MRRDALLMGFRGMRDMVVFTSKRIIALNVQAWSVETAGTFDLAAELELWFS